MLEIIDINTYYNTIHVLWDVSMKVGEASVGCILGRNGVGKTTIIRSIVGFTPPRSGVIRWGKEEITGLDAYKICNMGIGLVPQGRRIFHSLTVKENLIIAARKSSKGTDWSLEKVYDLFPILRERANHGGSALSGGEQQMLTIGRALITNPSLLLIDEPSEGLAPLIIKEITDVIKKLKKQGLSILIAEQNYRLALAVADYFYVVDKGRIVYENFPEELERDPTTKDLYLGLGVKS
jgi:branched-chain amino acid transport system ATP-binding protein